MCLPQIRRQLFTLTPIFFHYITHVHLLQFSPPSIPDILCPPHRASGGSEIHVFLVIERNSREARSIPLLKIFLWTWRCTTFNSIPIIIFDQYWPIRKSHQIIHSQFVKWERSIVPIILCYLPPFITSPLAFLLTIERHLPKMDHSWPPPQATPFVRVKLTLSSLRTRKGKKKEEEFTCHYCHCHFTFSSPFSHPFSKTGQ